MASEPLFDAETFMNQSIDTEGDTSIPAVPEGEYSAVVDHSAPRSGTSDKGPWAMLDIFWSIDDQALADDIGRSNPMTVKQSIFLDVDGAGNLEVGKGKNVGLHKVREALGQNRPGNWSPPMMDGRPATVLVTNRIHEGMPYDEVKKVTEI